MLPASCPCRPCLILTSPQQNILSQLSWTWTVFIYYLHVRKQNFGRILSVFSRNRGFAKIGSCEKNNFFGTFLNNSFETVSVKKWNVWKDGSKVEISSWSGSKTFRDKKWKVFARALKASEWLWTVNSVSFFSFSFCLSSFYSAVRCMPSGTSTNDAQKKFYLLSATRPHTT